MSTKNCTCGPSEDCSDCPRPPQTWEEYQRALREAFVEGALWLNAYDGEIPARERVGRFREWARGRYPIKRTVPRTVEGPGWKASVLTCLGGPHVEIRRVEDSMDYAGRRLDARDLQKLADLLENPDEEVEE